MTGRAVAERYAKALAENDLAAQRELLHPEYVGRYPQSGEVIRGVANRVAVGEQYPGRETRELRAELGGIRGKDEHYVTAPSWPAWSLVHISGTGDEFTLFGTITYPNADTWHAVALITLRDGKIWREIDYFAPRFDPPEWRAAYVDRE